MIPDIAALIAEARDEAELARQYTRNAEPGLYDRLADALEYADAEAEFYKRQFKKALEHVPPGVRYGLTAGSSDISPAERRRIEEWRRRRKAEPPSTSPTSPAGGGE
jgi:hypothetical protein